MGAQKLLRGHDASASLRHLQMAFLHRWSLANSEQDCTSKFVKMHRNGTGGKLQERLYTTKWQQRCKIIDDSCLLQANTASNIHSHQHLMGHALMGLSKFIAKMATINIYYYYYPFNGHFSRTTWVSRYQKSETSLGFKWGKRWPGCWDAVASAGPYANNLHLTPDR